MNDFAGFSLTEDRVEGLLSRAVKQEDGRFASELSEDNPLEGRSEFGITEAHYVTVADIHGDPFKSANQIRSLHDHAEDEEASVFLRIGGVITSAGRDDNGVALTASAIRTLPQDFQARTTLLFNHQQNTAIGRIVNARVVQANGSKPSRVFITADVHRSAVNPETTLTFAEMIRSGLLSKYSFAWSVLRGEVVFDFSKGELEIDEDNDLMIMPIGREFAPEINVFSLRATEASVVSVPAQAGADLTVARQFARSLGAARSDWLETYNGLLVPIESLRSVPTVDRPFHAVMALARIQGWAASGDKLDLYNDNDFASYAQAFAGHENDGRSVGDWYGLHCDIVDGVLVSNKRAIPHCLSELEDDSRSADWQRMCRELSIVHEIEVGN